MKKVILLVNGLLLLCFLSVAQEIQTNNNWGIETELFQPFYPTVNIIRVQATRTITNTESKFKGDIILGAYIRPNVNHDVVEKINEYMIALGFRQYFLKGLHIEVKSNIGYAWGTKNLIDNKDYETPTWFWEANIGYRFYFKSFNNKQLYITPQFGGLGNIVGNIGPRGGKPDNFLHGNIYLGINY